MLSETMKAFCKQQADIDHSLRLLDPFQAIGLINISMIGGQWNKDTIWEMASVYEACKYPSDTASANTKSSTNFFIHVFWIGKAEMLHTSRSVTGSDAPTASEQT